MEDVSPQPSFVDGSDFGGECSICLDVLTKCSATDLVCGHSFHLNCISKLREFRLDQVCPLCRAPLKVASDEYIEKAVLRYMQIKKKENNQEEVQEMLDNLKAIVLKKKDSAVAHILIGEILRVKKDILAAEEEFRAATRIDPSCIMARFNLAATLAERGQLADAETEFLAIGEYSWNNPLMHYNLGNVYHRMGEYRKAEKHFQMALDMDSFSRITVESHIGLGAVFHCTSDWDRAEVEWREAIAITPNNASLHHCLGLTLIHKKILPAAEDAFRESIRLDPNAAEAHVNLGITLTNRGQLLDAKSHFTRALEIEPDNSRAKAMLESLPSQLV